MSKAKATKSIFDTLTKAAPKVLSADKVNRASNATGYKNYLKELGMNFGSKVKTSEIEKVAEQYFSPSVAKMVNAVGLHKVATKMAAQEGTNYGSSDNLNIVKVATILGTKLAMINRERGSIISGLSHLKDLEG